MSHTCIIASGAWPEAELEAEFGRIPPAFLPIGNRRLFVHQQAVLRPVADRVILSLPDDFVPDGVDLDLLQELGIELVGVPPGLSLGQSIVYVINVTASSGGRVSVLHGDTLLRGFDPAEPDVVSVGAAPPGYRWGRVTRQEGLLTGATPGDAAAAGQVLSGWFSFADAALLVQSVTRRGGEFLPALEAYAAQRPLRTVEAAEWLDFGHANTYHQSRRRMTTERAFNRLDPGRRTVVKSGRDPRKIEAEGRWFEALPPAMRLHAPAFLGLRVAGAETSYAIEYLHLPTLTDLFVFGRLPPLAWGRIFDACDEFLTACAGHRAPDAAAAPAQQMYGAKTRERLESFARARNLDLAAPCRLGGAWLPSLERIAAMAAAAVPKAEPRHLTLIHGDFCFSNIFYDPRADLVRVIDPRGIDSSGALTPHGDLRYDLGKLHHSVIGRYDHIVAGYYRLAAAGPLDLTLELPDSPALRGVEEAFLAHRFAGLGLEEAAAPAIGVLLFLSMLPLHADDPARQDAFLANAMRLFLLLDRGGPAGVLAA